jgi:ribosomal protein S12 methylthiotransferase
MNRHGDKKMICDVVEKLRREIPDIVIRTTFIVGFPGETEEDFVELCEFVKKYRFERVGVFTYSREEDTPAYDFDGQIDEQLKQDRMDILRREQLDINEENNKKLIGRTVDVLCEDYDPVSGVHFGRDAGNAPEIDGKIYFRSDVRIAAGSFVKVKLREVVDYDVIGRAITSSIN